MQRARHKDGFYRLKNFSDRPEILGQSEHERVTQWARRHADGSHLVPPMSVTRKLFYKQAPKKILRYNIGGFRTS